MILASYSAACIIIRPIAGYLIDTLKRKPVYIVAYFVFMAIFCGYIVSSMLSIFIILRVFQGFAFGTTSVTGNTIVVDISPESRCGEALGYYGLANTLSICLGPMVGLYLKGHYSYQVIFLFATIICVIGFAVALLLNTNKEEKHVKTVKHKFSFSNLFIAEGAWLSIVLVLVSVPYGVVTAYIAVYSDELAMPCNAGLYYTLMAVGLGASRLIAGKLVDKCNISVLIYWGLGSD